MTYWDEMTEDFEGWQGITPSGSGQITTLDASDVQIVERILNGNGNGNGNGPMNDADWLGFASSAGGGRSSWDSLYWL